MNIKTTSILAVAMLAVSACNLNAQSNYSVSFGVPAEKNNTMAYLYDWDSSQKVDSAVVTDGIVKFTGNIQSPFIGSVVVDGGRGPVLIVEPGDITIKADGSVTGSQLNAKLESYGKQMQAVASEYQTLDQNDSIQKAKGMALYQEYMNIPVKAYEENKGNLVGLYWFLQLANEMNLQKLDEAIAADQLLGSSKRVQAIRTNLLSKAETSEGKHYKDFTVSYDGKQEKFSDYVKPGRYTLVDFWASWCGPCIRQTKFIKELYAKYKDKGLDVVGVAVWDEPDNTLKAIKQHGLEWPCIINAQSVPTELYGITGIPCIILINPEGIIVSRDKMSQELVDAVDSAMAGFQPQAAASVSSANDTAAVKTTDDSSLIF